MTKEEEDSASPPDLSDDSAVEASAVNERSLLRKLDVRLLPAVGVLYLLSFLDRSNGMPLALAQHSQC